MMRVATKHNLFVKIRPYAFALTGVSSLMLTTGCMGPNYARISNELRAKNNQLTADLAQAHQQQADSQQTIKHLESQLNAKTPRVATLPDAQLDNLFTVGKIEIQKSSDLNDTQHDGQPDAFRVFVRTYTTDGTILPATGQLTITAFDLALPGEKQKLGEWSFTPQQLKSLWYSQLGLNHFALNCPLKTLPTHNEITLRVSFVEALTNHAFTHQQIIKLHGLK